MEQWLTEWYSGIIKVLLTKCVDLILCHLLLSCVIRVHCKIGNYRELIVKLSGQPFRAVVGRGRLMKYYYML